MPEFIFLILVFAFTLAALLALYNNITVIKKYKIKTDKQCNMRIAVLSDYHSSRGLSKSVFQKLADCKPDIIVIAGDFVDRRHPYYDDTKQLLKRICEISPVYFTNGNNEDFIGSGKTEQYLDCKDIMLNEQYKILENYSILGISDSISGNDGKKSDLLRLFEQLDNYKIVVCHRPTEFSAGLNISGYDVDLVISGHCHGGMIRIPFFGALISPDEGFFPKYSKGLYFENGSTMAVSGGAGNHPLPLRLNNFPEIMCIDIEN